MFCLSLQSLLWLCQILADNLDVNFGVWGHKTIEATGGFLELIATEGRGQGIDIVLYICSTLNIQLLCSVLAASPSSCG